VLLVIGWALLYWVHLPSTFLLASGLDPKTHSGFNDALYLSLSTLTTLGCEDITPTSEWLRVVTLLEAMVGFEISTVSLSERFSQSLTNDRNGRGFGGLRSRPPTRVALK
jgi:uncharacterized membrane protein